MNENEIMKMKMKSIRIQLQRIKTWLVMLLLLAGSMTGFAQSEYFDYEDPYYMTIINGLTSEGLAASSLTIPKEVITVKSGAFSSPSAKVSALVIEAGGNPAFKANLFGTYNNSSNEDVPRDNPLGDIQILGNSMSVSNIKALFASLGAQGALSTVYIEGYSGAWSNIGVTDVLTEKVEVRLPAALVSDQQFGNAKVSGRFSLTKDLVTFCGNVTFRDTDNGSNMLFYVADYRAGDGRLHIQRVSYVKAGKGVLIHRAKDTSTYADLPRYSESISSADETLYSSNKLVGVTLPTLIGSTDGGMTNYILKDGAFHPTSGGTVKANKAYLQIPTSAAREMLTISFDDEETTGVAEVRSQKEEIRGEVYDLSGRRVAHPTKGLYITNGKKYVIR